MLGFIKKNWKILLILSLFPIIFIVILKGCVRYLPGEMIGTIDGWLGFLGGYFGVLGAVGTVWFQMKKETEERKSNAILKVDKLIKIYKNEENLKKAWKIIFDYFEISLSRTYTPKDKIFSEHLKKYLDEIDIANIAEIEKEYEIISNLYEIFYTFDNIYLKIFEINKSLFSMENILSKVKFKEENCHFFTHFSSLLKFYNLEENRTLYYQNNIYNLLQKLNSKDEKRYENFIHNYFYMLRTIFTFQVDTTNLGKNEERENKILNAKKEQLPLRIEFGIQALNFLLYDFILGNIDEINELKNSNGEEVDNSNVNELDVNISLILYYIKNIKTLVDLLKKIEEYKKVLNNI